MKDYSDYLNRPGMLDFIEKSWTTECKGIHDSFASAVNDLIFINPKIKSVIEIGYGSGEVARRLNAAKYYGYDSNDNCQKLARNKIANRSYLFFTEDIRKIKKSEADLVCTFGVLKHFGLHEWGEIFKKVCSLGKYLVFNMPIAELTKDDGTDFHHVWMNREELEKFIADNGFEILEIRNDFPIEPIFICNRK